LVGTRGAQCIAHPPHVTGTRALSFDTQAGARSTKGAIALTTADDSAEWLARGEAQRKAGRTVDAMLAYRRALRSKEHAVQAHFHLGELLHDVGRDAEAFAAWRAALTQQPEHVPSLLAFAAAMRRSGDFAEAARACRRVLACEPQHVGARVELALAQLPQGAAAAYSE